MDTWKFFLWSFHTLKQLPNNKCSYTERFLLGVPFYPYKAEGQPIIPLDMKGEEIRSCL
jgi:hypothetical protein